MVHRMCFVLYYVWDMHMKFDELVMKFQPHTCTLILVNNKLVSLINDWKNLCCRQGLPGSVLSLFPCVCFEFPLLSFPFLKFLIKSECYITALWTTFLQCVDSKQYCSRQSLRPYLDKAVSTAQQLASKGPLLPVPRRRRVPSQQGKVVYWVWGNSSMSTLKMSV